MKSESAKAALPGDYLGNLEERRGNYFQRVAYFNENYFQMVLWVVFTNVMFRHSIANKILHK